MVGINPFSIKTDNNLYSRNGNLHKIWSSVPLDQGGRKHHLSFLDFLNKTLLKMQNEYLNIFEIVNRVYFSAPSKVHQTLLSPLTDFTQDLEPMELWFRDRLRGHRKEIKKYLPGLENPDTQIRRKSRSCMRFEQALSEGKLDDYIGRETLTRPGSEGVRPGSEGVRPDTRAVKPSFAAKPCLKPSEDF